MANTYSDELKAQILAEAKLGASDRELARKFNVPRTTIRGWLGHDGREVAVPVNAHARLAELVYGYLETGLLALIAANKEYARPEVIASAVQSGTAHEIYGAISRQVVQVFRGLELNDDEPGSLPAADSTGEVVPG